MVVQEQGTADVHRRGAPTPDEPEAWLDLHGDALYRYAIGLVHDGHRAEDLVQETLLAAIGARQRFKGGAAERTWLIGILRHKILDEFRRQSRMDKLEQDAVVDGAFNFLGKWRAAPGNWSPEVLVQKEEFWGVLGGCMESLPEQIRAAFTLRVIEEHDAAEVCGALGIKAPYLWTLLHRARERLRMCLEAKWFLEKER